MTKKQIAETVEYIFNKPELENRNIKIMCDENFFNRFQTVFQEAIDQQIKELDGKQD